MPQTKRPCERRPDTTGRVRTALLGSMFACAALWAAARSERTFAQVVVSETAGAQPRVISAEDAAKIQAAQQAAAATPPQGEQPKQDKPADAPADGKPAGENKDKPAEGSGVVKRPTEPEFKPDPDELKVEPKNGKVQFSFYGQPWKDVLQWFADVSGVTFDWQELPEGFVNLTTTRAFSLLETRDLLNRQLLARGFTLLSTDETLTAVKIDKLDPSLIPTVDPDELEDRLPYDFVKVRFALPPAIEPAKAAEDVKILLSPHAKATPLLTTRRLLVIDAVSNLREVRDLLYAEQSAVREDVRPRVFMIRFRRADYIADQIMILLGLDPASRKNPMEQQLEQQRIQLYMQMLQKGTDVAPMLRKEGPPVFITVDKVRNSVLVNAPPDLMVTIERIVANFDVADDGGMVADNGQLELKRYKTMSSNTDALVTALKEIGSLHPLTQLQGDSTSKTIFAYATAQDHERIQGLLDKLDASGRRLRVIPLSRHTPAEQVAGTIQALMVGSKDKDSTSRRSRYSFYGFGDQPQEDESQFRIQADVENHRLLMWASDAEYEEVHSLLETLGVVVAPNAANATPLRVLEARSPEETAELLKQLQRAWSGKNPLQIERDPRSVHPERSGLPNLLEPNREQEEDEDAKEKQEDKFTRGGAFRGPVVRFARRSAGASPPLRLTADVDPEGAPSGEALEQGVPSDESIHGRSAKDRPPVAGDGGPAAPLADEAPPIKISVGADGRILLSSTDPHALDQLEDLILELSPPQPRVRGFSA